MNNMVHVKDDRRYGEFKSELWISATGSLFIALYQEDAVPRNVIRRLEADLEDHRSVWIELSSDHTGFQEMFDRLVPEAEGYRHLIHIVGIEKLPDKIFLDFMGNLQQFRQKIAAETSCAIVIWMIPAFEKLLFHSHPGGYREILGTYDFTHLSSRLQEPKAAPAKKQPELLERIGAYLRQVIHQFHNWKFVRESGAPFLIDVMAQADLHRFFLPVHFVSPQGKTFPLDDLLKVFLENKTSNFLALLGETGAGKSSAALYYFISLAEKYLDSREESRIPMFISLKGAAGRLNAEGYLVQQFEKMFDMRLSLIQLQDLLLRGRFIFFLDGFDRVTPTDDLRILSGNLEELAQLSVKNILIEGGIEKPQPSNKVIMTCRTDYFLMNIREPDPQKAGFTALYRPYAARENYQMVRIDPKALDESLIKTYVLQNTEDGITARNLLAVLGDPASHRISSGSILREMAVRTIRLFRAKKEINAADLYRAYTGLWIHAEGWRFRMTSEGRRSLMRRMAVKIYKRGNGYFISAGEIDPPSPGDLKTDGGPVDAFLEDLSLCEFVTRDAEGNFRFTHRSFMDYFFAETYFDAICRGGLSQSAEPGHLTDEIRSFLKLILVSEKSNLQGYHLSGLDFEGANLYQANLSGSKLNKANLMRAVLVNGSLRGADLSGADLSHAKLTRVDFRDADLTGADFSDARLRDADLRNARFNGAAFCRADLRGAKLQEARLSWVDLKEADLTDADLTGANLQDADLSGADLSGAILTEANLAGANLSRVRLKNADIGSADLTAADLTAADLTGANLSWAILNHTQLILAVLVKAKFREADLTRADLKDADAFQTDFRMARMFGVKMQGAKIREADFAGADLTQSRMEDADLAWSNFSNARLREADLSRAKLNMAKLIEADLQKAVLTEADLTWADLSRADLSRADLTGANLSEADLSEAVFKGAALDGANLKGANLLKTDLRDCHYKAAMIEGVDMTPART